MKVPFKVFFFFKPYVKVSLHCSLLTKLETENDQKIQELFKLVTGHAGIQQTVRKCIMYK